MFAFMHYPTQAYSHSYVYLHMQCIQMKAYMSRVLSPSTSFALLTLAVSVLLACVFGTYRDNHYTGTSRRWDS